MTDYYASEKHLRAEVRITEREHSLGMHGEIRDPQFCLTCMNAYNQWLIRQPKARPSVPPVATATSGCLGLFAWAVIITVVAVILL
jgi:hypothetical protein